MYWTLELASKLEDAPWPATKDELIDYAMRSGAPLEVIENLQEMEKISGQIIRVKKISSSTKKNISAIVSAEILLNPCKSVRFAGI